LYSVFAFIYTGKEVIPYECLFTLRTILSVLCFCVLHELKYADSILRYSIHDIYYQLDSEFWSLRDMIRSDVQILMIVALPNLQVLLLLPLRLQEVMRSPESVCRVCRWLSIVSV
jgi:hypothetical protein